jgi:hypothetical protein
MPEGIAALARMPEGIAALARMPEGIAALARRTAIASGQSTCKTNK